MSYRETFTSSGLPTDGIHLGTSRPKLDGAGRDVHAVSVGVRSAIGQACLEARFALLSAEIRSRLPEASRDDVSLNLFQESIPYPLNSAQARTLCERELSRSLAPTSRGSLRVVHLRFDDGSGRLLATADRAVFDKKDLHHLLEQLLVGTSVIWPRRTATGAAYAPVQTWAPFVAYPPIGRWAAMGEGEGSAATETVRVYGTQENLLVALARVFHAFCRGNEGSLPVLRDTGAGEWEWDLLALAVDPSQMAADAHTAGYATVHLSVVRPGKPHLEQLDGLWGSAAEFFVGLAFAGSTIDSVDGAFDARYIPFQTPPFPITLVAEACGADMLTLSVRYERKAIGEGDAQQLLDCVACVLSGITLSANRPLSQVPLVSDQMQTEILALGEGRHDTRLLSNQRLDQRIGTLAQICPGAIAITDGMQVISYGDLDDKAKRMASCLASRGISRGDRIGICLTRSANMLVAALAVMKAGAVYVPVDPDSPVERIAYICDDAGMSLIVVEQEVHAEIPGIPSLAMVEWSTLASGVAVGWQPDGTCTIDDPAYMIYTSGSTGRPKGVLVAHRNVQALLGAVTEDFALSNTDVWSLFHSFAFDFSVWEAWGALLTGARVHILSYDVTRNPDAFIDELNIQGITVLSQTPSAFGGLLTAERTRPVGSTLRLVVFGGEPLDATMLLPWFDRHPESSCRLVNMFGITETTVHVTAKDIRRRDAITGSRSVGRAIDGWRVSVHAPDGSLLPWGVDGEIYVAGAGVALGYHERPGLNQQRFIKDANGEGKMYRSGDRGRMLPSGELLHLGRLDNQIKLRGFRIELDEIRNMLLRCRGVEAAAVTFEQRDPADSATARIDAYVVMEEDDLRGLWAQAVQWLPGYMLPSSIARVSTMPLTGNGKLHVKKLEGLVVARMGAAERIVAPGHVAAEAQSESHAGSVEHHLREIWSEIFAQPVAADDNFFDLGGNSLLAIRMSARLRDRGLPGMSLRDLYVHQTVSGLAFALTEHRPDLNAVTNTKEGTP